MARIALKIDADTDRGTREGVPRLADALERLGAKATFLFSLGPDHTGRAIRRVFRRGFFGKVRRTSVVQHYGVKTLLYGTLLPGPHIGRRCAPVMRDVAQRAFEVGVHTYDHAKWQDGVASANTAWTRRELQRAQSQFAEVFGRSATVHGAAGWQMNADVPALEREIGFRYASDVRGDSPFLPSVHGVVICVPQLPTTLPTLDELVGREDLRGGTPVAHLLALTANSSKDHVFTLHAELEGGAYLGLFAELIKAWREQGHELCDLAALLATLDQARLPVHTIEAGSVEGRAGLLAVQGPKCTAASPPS